MLRNALYYLGLGLILTYNTSSGEGDTCTRDAYRDLVGRTEGKRQLGRPMRRRKDGIIMDF
jgi:hypothetical protein